MALEKTINTLKKPVLIGVMLGCLYGASGEFVVSDHIEREEAYYQKRSECVKMLDEEVGEYRAIENLISKEFQELYEGRIKNLMSKETQKMHEEKIKDLRAKQDLITKEMPEGEVINPQSPKIYYYPFFPSVVTADYLNGGKIDINLNPKISFILSGKLPETHRPKMYLANSVLWAGIGAGIGYGVKKIRGKFRKTNLKVKT